MQIGDNLLFQAGSTLGASNQFNILADFNDADVGTGVTVDLLSNIAAPVINLDSADDEDHFNFENLLANRYFVDGHGSTDHYFILLDGTSSERISVTDSGAGNDGADVLTVDGTTSDDLFLLRKYFLALLQPAVEPAGQDQLANTYERIDYDESINGRLIVHGWAGDDHFVTDDNSVTTTLDGGDGADQFQIGQVFGVDPNTSVATGDEIATQQITHGFLSRGVSMPMVVYGGNGADQFTVFSNKAAIRLEGEGGNDTFLIRAFIIEGNTDVEGGEGDDYVEYNINAPVSINGGDGFDRVVAVGTEADDSFVLTEDGIFGAGLAITVDGVEESVEVDGLEGNDSFFVLSTQAGVTYNIIGGLGSDTAIIGGDVTQRIVASQTTGSSAVINHGSTSTADIEYDGAIMPGVGVTVAGSQSNSGSVLGAVVITESSGSTEVTEDVVAGIGAFDEYTIGMALDRSQFAGAIVYLTISAAAASSANVDAQNRRGQSLEISIDGGTTYLPAAVLVFDASSDATWSVPQTVRVRAIGDQAQEGQRLSQINHSMISNDSRLMGIALPDVQATIFDDDLGGLIVRQNDGRTIVVEGDTSSADPAENGGIDDTFTVQLTSQPTADVTVTLAHDAQVSLSSTSLTFTSANWNVPQIVTVSAVNDTVPENRLTGSITMSMTSQDIAFDAGHGAVDQVLKVESIDDDSPGAYIVESDGSTLVSAGDANGVGAITDSYTIRLTKRPTGVVEIPLLTDGQTLVSGTDVQPADATHLHPYVVFDAATWNVPITVDVSANTNFSPTGQPTLTFAYSSHNTAAIQGNIIFRGGQGGTSRDIATAIMLPEEDPQPPVGQTDSTNELQQTDTLLIFNDASVSDDSLVVTPTNLSGINMSTTNSVIPDENGGPDTIIPAGINYYDLEVLQVMMGSGNDNITVNGSSPGTMTVIHGGGNRALAGGAMGSDQFTVTAGGVDGDLDIENNVDAPLILLGDTFQDGQMYSGTPGIGSGRAIAFDNFGNDQFNITSSMGVTVYGGSGDDFISGGSGDDLLLGGSGDDTILGNGGHDRIIGDSGINADLSTRMDRANQILSIVTAFDSNNTNANQDDLVAGDDDLSGNAGNDLIIGDHGTFVLGVIRPASTGNPADPNDDVPASTTQILLTSRAMTEARNEATSNGGSDQINGGDADDRILAGSGADFVNFDRNGNPLQLENGDDVIVGDNARLLFSHSGNLVSTDGFGWLMTAQSIAAGDGDTDLMTAGVGRKIIIGGKGNDSLLAGNDNLADTIFGDNAIAQWDSLTGIITILASSDVSSAGDDIITAGNARNILIGGSGADSITGGDSSDGDIIIGDNGQATFVAGILTTIESTSPTTGAADVIHAKDGPDVILGGFAGDAIDAGTDGSRDIVLGDNGIAHFLADGRITEIATASSTVGGNDDILVGDGNDIVFGGFGADAIGVDRNTLQPVGTDSGDDIILGDNGSATFYTGGIGSILTLITTTDPADGSNDLINASAGADIVLGGTGNDFIDAGSATTNDTSRDIVLGDNGEAVFNQQGSLELIRTLNPSIGGDDGITTGGGNDIVLGGFGADTIDSGTEADVVLGDNGRLDYLSKDSSAGSLDQIITTDPTIGGNDNIRGGSQNDVLIGGTGADDMFGEDGYDIIFGDHAEVDFSRPVDQQVISRFITSGDGGGNDNIEGGANDDFIFGGQGNDTIHGDAGQDDIVGGHNVAFGSDGDDNIFGDADEDVILGDNGIIGRTLQSAQLGTWQNYLAPFSSIVIRKVQPYDDLDQVAGDDTIAGGPGMDILRGQRGNDSISGGDGDDEIIGGLGGDSLNGDAGQDYILGDSGQILRDLNDDGTPQLNSDGSWHRDILTENIGRITAIIPTDPTSLANPISGLADQLLAADRIVMAGVTLSNDARKLSPVSGLWQTAAILIDLVDADSDTIDGSDGDDVMLGQRGNDTVRGGAGNDLAIGDHGINTAGMETDMPQMLDGIRLIGFGPSPSIPSSLNVQIPTFGTVIVPEFVSEPGKIVADRPRWDRVSPVNKALENLASSDQLVTSNNLKLTPTIQFTPSFVGHQGDLYGNDQVVGNAGNDMVVGDNLIVNSNVETGIAGVQNAIDAANSAITGVEFALESLLLDRDLVKFELDSQPVNEHVLSIAADSVSGGDGNDLVVGDNATIELPMTRALPGTGSVQTNAFNLQQHLSNMRTLAEDAMNLTSFAHLPLIDRLLQDAKAHRPSLPIISSAQATYLQHHRLEFGLDVLTGDAGDDTLIGGDSVLIAPLVTGNLRDLPSSTEVSGLNATQLHDLEVQLSTSAQQLDLQIVGRRTARTFQIQQELAKRTPLNRIAYVPSLDRNIDNDSLSGGDGADVISGDFTVLATPLVLQSPTTPLQLENLDAHVEVLVDQIANRDRLKIPTEFQLYVGRQALAAGSTDAMTAEARLGVIDGRWQIQEDEITGNQGADKLFGDDIAIVSPLMIDNLGSYTSLRQSTYTIAYLDDATQLFYGSTAFSKVQVLSNRDTVDGGAGNDTVQGMRGNDVLEGRDGDDTLLGGNGTDTSRGGTGVNDIRADGGDYPRLDLQEQLGAFRSANTTPVSRQLLIDAANGAGSMVDWAIDPGAGLPPGLGNGNPDSPPPSVPRTVQITGTIGAVPGQPKDFSATITDLPVGATAQYQWLVRDNQAKIIATGTGQQFQFTPPSTGIFKVTVAITDDQNGSGSATLNTMTSATQQLPDPANSGKSILVIGGTTGNDNIRLNRVIGQANSVEVRILNGTNWVTQVYSNISRIDVYAGDGEDDVTTDINLAIPLRLFGGNGDDKLRGGKSDDYLNGGAGNYRLIDQAGFNVLIGDLGADRLTGGDNEDLLISEVLNSSLSVDSLMQGWSNHSASFTQRVNSMAAQLTSAIVADGTADDLAGYGGRDWFFAQLSDRVRTIPTDQDRVNQVN
ncbi:MAG: hypothetical protein U0930_17230 [Pirellulales bacterium]